MTRLEKWKNWWRPLPLWQKIAPAAFALAYIPTIHFLGALRSDHWALTGAVLVLSYGGPRARTVLRFALPLLLTGIIYDSQRFYSDYIRGPIHVREPYLFDLRFFGIETEAGRLTPNEWWQLHTHPVLDLITGFFYLTFIAIFLAEAAVWSFWPIRAGRHPDHWKPMWAFLWVNLIGYSTYYWYAAAPPWYVSLYGIDQPANLSTLPNPAGCIRFDELLGTHFFTGMYGRSADVFGAIPSLHVAYPLLSVLYAFRFRSLRAFSVVFYVVMCFSAVYLNHHYVLDLIWGSVYAVLVYWAMDRFPRGQPRIRSNPAGVRAARS